MLFINLGFLMDADGKFQVFWSVNVKPEIVFCLWNDKCPISVRKNKQNNR